MADPIDLPDINVWLAFSFAHVHHSRARHYWYQESGSRLAFCRVAIADGLRLVSFDSGFSRYGSLDLFHLEP